MKKYRIVISTEGNADYIDIEGKVKIEKYSPCEITLIIGKSIFIIGGDNLSMPVFAEGMLKISGKVNFIEKNHLKEKK